MKPRTTSEPVTGKRRPEGGRGGSLFVSDEWLAELEAALARKGWTRTELASRIGRHPSALTVLFSKRRSGSVTIRSIVKELGISTPEPTEEETQWLSIGQHLRRRSPGDFARELAHLRGLLETIERLEEQRRRNLEDRLPRGPKK